MSKDLPELQVLIPYQQLVEFVQAAERVGELLSKVDRLEEQQTALRGQFIELMDAFKELD